MIKGQLGRSSQCLPHPLSAASVALEQSDNDGLRFSMNSTAWAAPNKKITYYCLLLSTRPPKTESNPESPLWH